MTICTKQQCYTELGPIKHVDVTYVHACVYIYTHISIHTYTYIYRHTAAAAAKSLQSCPTLCDPINGSPPGSLVPGILQTRTLEWVAIAFSSAGKWKVKVKSLSLVRLLVTPWTAAHGLQPTRFLHPWDLPGKSTGVGCHCPLWWLASTMLTKINNA